MKITIEIPDSEISKYLTGEASSSGTAAAASTGKATKEKAKAPEITLDDLRTAAGAAMKAGKSKEDISAILKTFGVAKVTDLKPADFGKFKAALEAEAEEDPLA